jgi:hypothetical protein
LRLKAFYGFSARLRFAALMLSEMSDSETKIFDEPAQPRGKLRRNRPAIANS